jgi:hypothetical protein
LDKVRPTLLRLDRRIREVRRGAGQLYHRRDSAAGAWLRAAWTCGTFGVCAIALSLLWTPTALLPTAGVLALLAAVGSMFCGVRARRGACDAHEAADAELDALTAQRGALLDGASLDDWGDEAAVVKRELVRVDGLMLTHQSGYPLLNADTRVSGTPGGGGEGVCGEVNDAHGG